MKAAKQDDKEKIKKLFYLEETDAFVSKEQVSIYLFDEGTTREVVDEEGNKSSCLRNQLTLHISVNYSGNKGLVRYPHLHSLLLDPMEIMLVQP